MAAPRPSHIQPRLWLLFLFSFSASVALALPRATAKVGNAFHAGGWTPKPTNGPVTEGLVKRQSSPATCGYISGSLDNPFTCGPSASCFTDSAIHRVGCCNGSCAHYSTCYDFTAVNQCTGVCAKCFSASPYCNKYSFTDNGNSMYFCASTRGPVIQMAVQGATSSTSSPSTSSPSTSSPSTSSPPTSSPPTSSPPTSSPSTSSEGHSSTPTIPSTQSSSPLPDNNGSGLSKGALAGIGVGAAAGGTTIIVIIVVWWQKKGKQWFNTYIRGDNNQVGQSG